MPFYGRNLFGECLVGLVVCCCRQRFCFLREPEVIGICGCDAGWHPVGKCCSRLRSALASGMHATRSDGGRLRHAQAAAEPEEPKFLAFVGSGRRLDGKPAAGGEPVPVTFAGFGPRLPAPAPGARPRLQALARADADGQIAWHSLPPGHPFAPTCPCFWPVRRATSGLAASGRAAGAGWQWHEQLRWTLVLGP